MEVTALGFTLWSARTGWNDDPVDMSAKLEVAAGERISIFGATIISGFLKFRTIWN